MGWGQWPRTSKLGSILAVFFVTLTPSGAINLGFHGLAEEDWVLDMSVDLRL